MSNEILDEVYAARERLWQLGGGTFRGVGEYLRECGRRAKARGVLWIESEEEREAIGAEVRARLAAEGAGCVREGRAEYGRGEARGTVKREKRKVKSGGRISGTTIQRSNGQTIQRSNDPTIQRKRISGRKSASAESEVML